MSNRNPPWTRDELILALDLYFRLNPVHVSSSHPEIISLSNLLNRLPIHTNKPNPTVFRNPNGTYMKLCNFLRLDPSYSGVGLRAGSKLDEEVWREFANDRKRLASVADAIRAELERTSVSSGNYDYDVEEVEAPEGKILFKQHKIRERNPSLVKKKKSIVAKQTNGILRCEVCGFVFKDKYGKLGEGFIECHHTVPLSSLRPGDKTKLKDLALVCSNCHRMLHRGGESLTVGALREIIQSQHT